MQRANTIAAQMTEAQAVRGSIGRVRTGWVISGLIAVFLLFDVVGKFAKPAAVVEGFKRSGWPIELSVSIGAILLVCTVLYLIPRTAALGAILLTGYLGGAVATNLRLENPLFLYTLFPVYMGVLIWVALYLRESRIGTVFPLLR
jgi:hypothetical protein